MTRETFTAAITVLASSLRADVSPALLEGYWLALKDLADDEMAGATRAALQTSKFMPSPAELLAFAGRAPRDLAAEAVLAWQAVRAAMDSHDVYANVDFGPVVNSVLHNLGGWLYLCEQSLPDLEWRRKDFERVYKLVADKEPSLLNGASHFGQWRTGPVLRLQIPGLPEMLPALPELETPQSAEMRKVVRELADGKSQAGAASNGSLAKGRAESDLAAPPPRETKPREPDGGAARAQAAIEALQARVATGAAS